MRRKISGTAKVKEDSNWRYKGLTLNIISKREPSRFEEEFGAEYELSLEGTEWADQRHTFIHAKHLEVKEDEYQISDELINTVITQVEKDIDRADITAIFELFKKFPVNILIAYLPEDQHDKFKSLID